MQDNVNSLTQTKVANRTVRWTYSLTFINLLITALSVLVGGHLVAINSPFIMFVLGHPIIMLLISIGLMVLFTASAFKTPQIALPFWLAISIIMGLNMSMLTVVVPTKTIVEALMFTGIDFVVLTVFSFQTKFNMAKLSGVMTGALVAIIIVSLLNTFVFKSPMLVLIVSIISIIVFSYWIMRDTQDLREANKLDNNPFSNGLLIGFSLYLDILNLFMSILDLLSDNN